LAAEAEIEALAEKARQLTNRVRAILSELRGARGRGGPVDAAPQKVRDKFDGLRRAIQQRYERDYAPRLVSALSGYPHWQFPPIGALIEPLRQDSVGVAREWLRAWALWREPVLQRLASERQRQREQDRVAALKLAWGRYLPTETPRPPTPAAAAISEASAIAPPIETPPPPAIAAPAASSPALPAPSTSHASPISGDTWRALEARDRTYAVFAFVSSRDGWSADVAACLTLMSPFARAIGERAVELGASLRGREGAAEDPEIALLLSAPELEPSSEQVAIFKGAGAVNVAAQMSETLRERERGR
jgi:hypothetical protein